MFHYTEKTIAKSVFQFQIKHQNQWLTIGQVVDLWRHSSAFRNFYTQILREVPYFGFFWENRPMSRANLSETYQFVILKTTAFNGKKATPKPFEDYFGEATDITCFPNLSNSAQLVVPCPSQVYPDGFAHLGSFIRNASEEQINAFWQCIGHQLQQHFEAREVPVWLSTSGLGVYWLHARLDDYPKYYAYEGYKPQPSS